MSTDSRLDGLHREFEDMRVEQTKIATRVKDMHHVLVGNGQPGMIAEFQQAKGGVKVAKFIASSGFITALIALVNSFMK